MYIICMYYIYHVPGIKYGATHRWPIRAIEQGYENVAYIYATCNTAEETDELERSLNIQAGYEWNESRSYLNMLAFASKGGRKLGCKFSNQHKEALRQAKLQPQNIVNNIRQDITESILSFRGIARKYNVSTTTIYNIRDKKKGY